MDFLTIKVNKLHIVLREQTGDKMDRGVVSCNSAPVHAVKSSRTLKFQHQNFER
jgi:hypothetical protein